jgi:hypothetical protein
MGTITYPVPIADGDLQFSPQNPDFTADAQAMFDVTSDDLAGMDSDATDLIDAAADLTAALPDLDQSLADAAAAAADLGDSGLDDDAATMSESFATGQAVLDDYGALIAAPTQAPTEPAGPNEPDLSQYTLGWPVVDLDAVAAKSVIQGFYVYDFTLKESDGTNAIITVANFHQGDTLVWRQLGTLDPAKGLLRCSLWPDHAGTFTAVWGVETRAVGGGRWLATRAKVS